jgi:hypothetical protein
MDVHGVRSMLDLYNVGGAQWTEIIYLCRKARKKQSQHVDRPGGQGYLRLEMDATVVHDYQLAYVPGRTARRLVVAGFDPSVGTRWRGVHTDPPRDAVAAPPTEQQSRQ